MKRLKSKANETHRKNGASQNIEESVNNTNNEEVNFFCNLKILKDK